MKNIVYKITFVNRKQSNTKPYYYVGSKSNCEFIDGVIYDRFGKPYYGSSHYEQYHDIVNSDKCVIDILYEGDDFNDVLKYERDYHIIYDVVASTEYFNLSVATTNNFNDPEYATYKHVVEGKIVRLKKDHPMVIDGTYVGVTQGVKLSEEHKKKISMKGDKNPFYGKRHSDDTKSKIGDKNRGRKASDETKQKMSSVRKGVGKSDDHKAKIGRKGMTTLKNLNTGECIRICKTKLNSYDLNLWVVPYKYKSIKNPESIKGKCNLINIETLERIRINTSDKSEYDSSVWLSPQAFAKLKKEGKLL